VGAALIKSAVFIKKPYPKNIKKDTLLNEKDILKKIGFFIKPFKEILLYNYEAYGPWAVFILYL
jgi:hypothetical protein